jgi:hypothetical protein
MRNGDEAARQWYWEVLSGARSSTDEEGSPGDVKVVLLSNNDAGGKLTAVANKKTLAFTYAASCWLDAKKGVPNKKCGGPETVEETRAREWFLNLQVERKLISDILSKSERVLVYGSGDDERRINVKRNHLTLFLGTGRPAKDYAEYWEARQAEGTSSVGGGAQAPPQVLQDPLKAIAEKAPSERVKWAKQAGGSANGANDKTIMGVLPELLHLAGMLRVGKKGKDVTSATFEYGLDGYPRTAPLVDGWHTIQYTSSPENLLKVFSALAGALMGEKWQETAAEEFLRYNVLVNPDHSTEKSIHISLANCPTEVEKLPEKKVTPFIRTLFALLSVLGGKKRVGLQEPKEGERSQGGACDAPFGLFGDDESDEEGEIGESSNRTAGGLAKVVEVDEDEEEDLWEIQDHGEPKPESGGAEGSEPSAPSGLKRDSIPSSTKSPAPAQKSEPEEEGEDDEQESEIVC